ncbi:MAG: phenylalanine--tRNA ligase subunit beta [Pseudomonadales bacterium]|nr:phenylalanine--tRNA ligase subunit beta [Pseudomonadales bacterium]
MKFSENWLREWVSPALSTEQLVEQLTMAGLEVDAVAPVAASFRGVVVAEIVSAEPHPDADKLQVCQVNTGDELVQVVCGAPNARPGLKVPFATVGAILPDDFKINKAKLRGVESFGMLTGASELGLEEKSPGLMELPVGAPLGKDIREYLKLDDQQIEVDLTPNRGDCLSILGLARETAALNKLDFNPEKIAPVTSQIEDQLEVTISATEECPRYIGRVIRNLDMGAVTPLWMKEKLRRSGIRSIDPIVDVTNYVLIELGQPLHAFDANRLSGNIKVRLAETAEKITLLDSREIELNADTLVIADDSGAIAVAGIMGGESTAVCAETRDLFLESAFFAPLAIVGRARSYNMQTDASHRFERGVDYCLQRDAIERATTLILEIAGGQPGAIIENVERGCLPSAKPVDLTRKQLDRILGVEITDAELTGMFTRLGMPIEQIGSDWKVTPPPHRFDIEIEADLIEEVARLYGYNLMPTRTSLIRLDFRPDTEAVMSADLLKECLVHRGYQEVITYSFVEPKLQNKIYPDRIAKPLLNPMSQDMSVMRTGLWSGLLNTLTHNVKRRQLQMRLFETGLQFVEVDGELEQKSVMAGLVYGNGLAEGWSNPENKLDFFDLKGDVESLLEMGAHVQNYSFAAAQYPSLHPGQTAKILFEGKPVGILGALHPELQGQLDLADPVFLFEIELDFVCQRKVIEFVELSKFPGSRRDLSLSVPSELSVGELLAGIRASVDETFQDVVVFDLYEGEGVEAGRKSIALGLTFQHHSRTLNEDEVNQSIERIVTYLSNELNVVLRA